MPTTPTTSRVGETTLQSKKILKNRINTDAPILSNATPAAQTLRKSPNGKTYKSTPSPVTLPASKLYHVCFVYIVIQFGNLMNNRKLK